VSDLVSLTLHSALDGLALQQRVIADDIANVDTPGYHARSVDFASSLRSALGEGDEDSVRRALLDAEPTVSVDPVVATANGNNVDLANETMSATQALTQYQLVTRAVDDRAKLVRTAIMGQ
jgi:flagellar basal-body rod protein FlgB